MIYLGSDHRGFALKEKIKDFLLSVKYNFKDLGANSLEPKDDYTSYAAKVAEAVQKEKKSFGILLCGSGVGVDVTANKFDGVRASVGKNSAQIHAGRRDDDMNVLVIAADFTKEDEARDMVNAFLSTKFDDVKRHKRRLADIKKIEKAN